MSVNYHLFLHLNSSVIKVSSYKLEEQVLI